ncbi:SDR family oxidoreductase [Mycolicibacterium wolinskyi]|uniref:SDR family oxidoreductase n=1 Tax=Mycolicibacterium wolinskyi TaxID=59750 RepID=UPI0039178B1D
MTQHGSFDLRGSTAVVTGSSGGIGRAIAAALAGAGAEVVVTGRRDTHVAETVEQIRSAGGSAAGYPLDVRSAQSVSALFDTLDREHRRIDILVNNAGVQLRKPLLEVTEEDWTSVLDANLTGAFRMGAQVARRLIAQRRPGKIINIASLTSSITRPGVGAYAASKGGLLMLTRAMAAEWGPHGLQANAIGPGVLATDMTAELTADPDYDAWLRRRTPAGRWGSAHDVTGAAVFLCSPASDFVNGQILYVDGGVTAVM